MSKELTHEFASQDEWRQFLDQSPSQDWLQIRDLGGTKKHTYLPLFILEGNADICFREWFVVDEKYAAIKDGVMCTVKINALPDYPGADYITFTGTAAIPFKSVGNAVEFDVPNARERAIGKAFATLGNIFGRSLNRTYKHNGKIVKLNSGFTFKKWEK